MGVFVFGVFRHPEAAPEIPEIATAHSVTRSRCCYDNGGDVMLDGPGAQKKCVLSRSGVELLMVPVQVDDERSSFWSEAQISDSGSTSPCSGSWFFFESL